MPGMMAAMAPPVFPQSMPPYSQSAPNPFTCSGGPGGYGGGGGGGTDHGGGEHGGHLANGGLNPFTCGGVQLGGSGGACGGWGSGGGVSHGMEEQNTQVGPPWGAGGGGADEGVESANSRRSMVTGEEVCAANSYGEEVCGKACGGDAATDARPAQPTPLAHATRHHANPANNHSTEQQQPQQQQQQQFQREVQEVGGAEGQEACGAKGAQPATDKLHTDTTILFNSQAYQQDFPAL